MFVKTEALILSVKKHRDNAMLVQAYASEFGRISFLVYGGHGRRGGKSFASVLHPFSLVEVELEMKPHRDLHISKEIKSTVPLNGILFDPQKSTLAIFLAEILLSSLKTAEKDRALFTFLKESVLTLDRLDRGIANFHIAFLLKFTYFLGVFPNVSDLGTLGYFDMRQAEFSVSRPLHSQYIDSVHGRAIQLLTRMNYQNLHLYRFSRDQRRETLEKIIEYYRIHLQGFGEIISFSVLQSIFA